MFDRIGIRGRQSARAAPQPKLAGTGIGYVRVRTVPQTLDQQNDALEAAGRQRRSPTTLAPRVGGHAVRPVRRRLCRLLGGAARQERRRHGNVTTEPPIPSGFHGPRAIPRSVSSRCASSSHKPPIKAATGNSAGDPAPSYKRFGVHRLLLFVADGVHWISVIPRCFDGNGPAPATRIGDGQQVEALPRREEVAARLGEQAVDHCVGRVAEVVMGVGE